VEELKSRKTYWTACPECKGQGQKRQRLRKKVKLIYQKALEEFEKTNGKEKPPIQPRGHLYLCTNCSGSGLVASEIQPKADHRNLPHIAIIGGGIGGVALAVACLHRKIPFTLFERDPSFDARSQGYGLTLQQASKAIHGFGIVSLEEGIVSTRHLVHTTNGSVIGEWGMRKWMQKNTKKKPKRNNIHIARQSLRLALLQQLGGDQAVQWNHQLIGFKECKNDAISLNFQVNGKTKNFKADLVVGADGIRSTVRKILIGETATPLRYLDCIVILGICELQNLKDLKSDLLDSATVFQTANGTERIYMMPYDSDSIMWQLSFPIPEEEAKALNSQGAEALKKEACLRTQWHTPIPEILAATPTSRISGYPVYDRKLLSSELLQKGNQVTLIGDAAHPMSPFKGQGANQALLDALALARGIAKGCHPLTTPKWKDVGIRTKVLTPFELEMLNRSAPKVKDSAEASQFLHSEIVLRKNDAPRGKPLKRKENH